MTIAEELKTWVAQELLEGADVGLTDSTPLLELGLIDSMSIVMLQKLAASRFGVEIPQDALTPQNLGSIQSIASLIAKLKGAPA